MSVKFKVMKNKITLILSLIFTGIIGAQTREFLLPIPGDPVLKLFQKYNCNSFDDKDYLYWVNVSDPNKRGEINRYDGNSWDILNYPNFTSYLQMITQHNDSTILVTTTDIPLNSEVHFHANGTWTKLTGISDLASNHVNYKGLSVVDVKFYKSKCLFLLTLTDRTSELVEYDFASNTYSSLHTFQQKANNIGYNQADKIALLINDNKLYVHGQYDSVDHVAAQGLGYYDGTSFTKLNIFPATNINNTGISLIENNTFVAIRFKTVSSNNVTSSDVFLIENDAVSANVTANLFKKHLTNFNLISICQKTLRFIKLNGQLFCVSPYGGGAIVYDSANNTWIAERSQFFDGIGYYFKDNYYIFSGEGKLPYISGLKGCFKVSPSTYTEGYAYFDINGNCSLDASDSLLRKHWVNITDGSKNYGTISDKNGWYEMPITVGNYTYSTGVINFKLAACGTDTLNADSFISYNRNIAYDFKSPYDNSGDIEITTAGGIMRRGNAYTLYLKLKNLGKTPLTISPTLQFDPKLSFTSSNYSINKSLSGQLEFAPVTVKVFEDQKLIIHFYVHQDSVKTNDILTFVSSTDLTNTEVTYTNNQYIYKETVMGPYDPNAIHGNPENKIWTSPKTIKYTIEFQNLGSDTAFNVRIEDLMPSGLDLSNIDIIEHSGPNIYTMVDDRNIKFYLNSQRLTPSSKNEEKSKGYIIFTIPVTDSLSIGERFDNLAGIYFDYEDRINTNVTSVLRVKEGTSIDEISSIDLPILIYPNPGSQVLNLEAQYGEIQTFKVYNAAGQSIYDGRGNQSIDVSSWNSGIYMLLIEFEGRQYTVIYNKL